MAQRTSKAKFYSEFECVTEEDDDPGNYRNEMHETTLIH